MSRDPEGPENDGLSVIGPPPDVPDDTPDAQSTEEDKDLARKGKLVAIEDRQQGMAERSLTVKVVLVLAVISFVCLLTFLFLAGLRVVHIPDSAWPYLFGALPTSAVVGLIAYLLPKKPS